MSIPPVSLIGWLHTAVCSAAMAAGAAALWSRKGSALHKRWGGWYVHTMLAAQLTALLIYSGGGFGIFHWLAVVALLLVVLGAFAAPRQARAPWSLTHVSCMVWSYYLLIGGAVNEAFLRLSVLRSVSPMYGGPRHYLRCGPCGRPPVLHRLLGHLAGRAYAAAAAGASALGGAGDRIMTIETGTHDMREEPGGMFPGHAAPAHDLALIRRMMEEARQAVALDGRHLVLWGVLLALAACGESRGSGLAPARSSPYTERPWRWARDRRRAKRRRCGWTRRTFRRVTGILTSSG